MFCDRWELLPQILCFLNREYVFLFRDYVLREHWEFVLKDYVLIWRICFWFRDYVLRERWEFLSSCFWQQLINSTASVGSFCLFQTFFCQIFIKRHFFWTFSPKIFPVQIFLLPNLYKKNILAISAISVNLWGPWLRRKVLKLNFQAVLA